MHTPLRSSHTLALQLTFLHGVMKPAAAAHPRSACVLTRGYTQANMHRFYTHLWSPSNTHTHTLRMVNLPHLETGKEGF